MYMSTTSSSGGGGGSNVVAYSHAVTDGVTFTVTFPYDAELVDQPTVFDADGNEVFANVDRTNLPASIDITPSYDGTVYLSYQAI